VQPLDERIVTTRKPPSGGCIAGKSTSLAECLTERAAQGSAIGAKLIFQLLYGCHHQSDHVAGSIQIRDFAGGSSRKLGSGCTKPGQPYWKELPVWAWWGAHGATSSPRQIGTSGRPADLRGAGSPGNLFDPARPHAGSRLQRHTLLEIPTDMIVERRSKDSLDGCGRIDPQAAAQARVSLVIVSLLGRFARM